MRLAGCPLQRFLSVQQGRLRALAAAKMTSCTAKGCRSAGSSQAPAWAILAGLLSSSCCVLQLALNYFALGCAGFAGEGA